MNALLLLAAAFAGEPVGEGVPIPVAQLEDIDSWLARGRELLEGPDACIEVEGQARMRFALYAPGGLTGGGERREIEARGPFSGRLDHGVWVRIEADLENTGAKDEIDIDSVQPVMGRKELGTDGEPDERGSISVGTSTEGTTVAVDSGGTQALTFVDGLIAMIDPSVTTTYTTWDPEDRAVVLQQFVVMGDNPNAQETELRTRFPEGGPPTALDVILPRRVSFREGMVRFRLLNAQVHIRGLPTELGVLPAQESTSLVAGVLGFTLGVEQHLVYTRARACPVGTPDPGSP